MRELGRFLAREAGGGEDLNSAFHHLVQKDTAGAPSLRAAFDLLRHQDPEWPVSLRQELTHFVAGPRDVRRQGRLSGSKLAAATKDPRSKARE